MGFIQAFTSRQAWVLYQPLTHAMHGHYTRLYLVQSALYQPLHRVMIRHYIYSYQPSLRAMHLQYTSLYFVKCLGTIPAFTLYHAWALNQPLSRAMLGHYASLYLISCLGIPLAFTPWHAWELYQPLPTLPLPWALHITAFPSYHELSHRLGGMTHHSFRVLAVPADP